MDTYTRHLTAITSGEVDKTNVAGLRRIINNGARERHGWSVPRGALSHEAADLLEVAVMEHMPKVTGTLHDTGLKVLTNPRYKKRLADYADIIASLDHFKLDGFVETDYRNHYAPTFKAVAKDGSWFRFVNVPWQSGGKGPEVLGA